MLALVLLACKGKDIEGTWMVLTPFHTSNPACSDIVEHNFLGGFSPEEETPEDGDWQSESSTTGGDALDFWRIYATSDGAVLLAGEEAWPGSRADDGSWLFSWTEQSTTVVESTHAFGYTFIQDEVTTVAMELSLSFQRDAFAGELRSITGVDAAYTESDAWSQEIGEVGATGRIPSGEYLVWLPEGAIEPSALWNSRDTAQCSGLECTLDVVRSCTERWGVEGTRVLVDEEAAYGHLGEAGQE